MASSKPSREPVLKKRPSWLRLRVQKRPNMPIRLTQDDTRCSRSQQVTQSSGVLAGAQRELLANDYRKINENKGENNPAYFMDAVHPRHNPVLAHGWIKRGEEQPIPTNTGRKRLNINGAIDLR